MSVIDFAIIGGGWRAEFFLRVAAALPERFRCVGMLVRDTAKGNRLEKMFGVRTYRDLDALMSSCKPMYAITSVPWEVSAGMIKELVGRGMAVLAETPPAPDIDSLIMLDQLVRKGAKIQVVEQLNYQPQHAARLAIASSGKIGTVSQAQVSVCHGYHAASLIRHLLGVTFEEATITACKFTAPVIERPGRSGPPQDEKVVNSTQVLACLDFGGKLGIYDFVGDQYFSWIRSQRVNVRGERGEITNTTVCYLKDFRTPVELELRRIDAGQNGNLEGYYHKGILAGQEWVYRNPFAHARLSDEEISVATIMAGMAEYIGGGPEVYSLAEAAQDRWLDVCIGKAAESGQKVKATRQPWAT